MQARPASNTFEPDRETAFGKDNIQNKSTMYLHPEFEKLTRSEIEVLQLERLKKTVNRCMNTEFYRKRFAENNITPDDIRSLSDLYKIPFTTKQDLRESYPFKMSTVPLSQVVRLHSSSGTTGTPTVILHTQKDLDEWARPAPRRHFPELVGIRHVHRRARIPVRC